MTCGCIPAAGLKILLECACYTVNFPAFPLIPIAARQSIYPTSTRRKLPSSFAYEVQKNTLQSFVSFTVAIKQSVNSHGF